MVTSKKIDPTESESNNNMKTVTWTTPDGYNHCAKVRDDDADEMAPKIGIPCEPPDINFIDWEGVKRDLHNLLVARGLTVMADITRQSDLLRSAAQSVLYKRLIALYQQTPPKEEGNG